MVGSTSERHQATHFHICTDKIHLRIFIMFLNSKELTL